MSNKTILVIDDEPSVGLLVTHVLRDAGFEVVFAKNGRDGIATFASRSFDAVFVDLMMPDVSGVEVIQALKAREPKIPIVLMTAEAEHHIPSRRNVDHYLNKPFRIATLEATARLACGLVRDLTPIQPSP